jgi:lipopolysaccharide assembly outer membrane protein LptD (OstA)
MKFLILGALIACPVILSCQEQKTPEQAQPLHLWSAPNGTRVAMAADSIARQDPDPPRPSPYASVIRLKGNVNIRTTTCIPAGRRHTKVCEAAMLLRADEADFREETGEIEARGNVRVTLHPPYPDKK